MNTKYSALDLSFYNVDTQTRPQHIAALISFPNFLVSSVIEKKLDRIPADYPSILIRSTIKSRIYEQPPYFKCHEITESISEFVGKRMMSEKFFQNRMWEILYIRNVSSDKVFLLFRLHHSLADGISGLNFFHDILFGIKGRSKILKIPKSELSFFKSLSAMFTEATLPAISPVAEIKESRKRSVFFITIPIAEINTIKKNLIAGIHEISLLIASEFYFQLFPNAKKFRALIPVALKTSRRHGVIGNFIGGTSLDIIKEDRSNLTKIEKISDSLGRKSGPNSYGAYLYFSKIMKFLPRILSKKIAQFESAKMSAIVTSLNGPKINSEDAFSNEYAIPALMPGQNIGFGFIKNKNNLDIAIIVDENIGISRTDCLDLIGRTMAQCEIKDWEIE